jgi:hypothetical protein
MSIGGVILGKEKDRKITIFDRSAPRIAIQITEISVDAKKKTPPATIRRAPDRHKSVRGRGQKTYHQGNRKGRRSIESAGNVRRAKHHEGEARDALVGKHFA